MTKKKTDKAKRKINDDQWIGNHFEEIIDKYAGQHIVICCGEIFIGEDAIDKAKKKHPNTIATSMPVPRPEDFIHILISCQYL